VVDDRLSVFVELSAYLTGFAVVDLYGTGMAPAYLATVDAQTPPDVARAFFTQAVDVLRLGDRVAIEAAIREQVFPADRYGGLAQNVIVLWYLGQWAPTVNANGVDLETVRNVSAEAYVQGLVWTAAQTHPPGAKQQGYGAWAQPPLTETAR
jgi:hypothetical protein